MNMTVKADDGVTYHMECLNCEQAICSRDFEIVDQWQCGCSDPDLQGSKDYDDENDAD